MPNLAAGWGPGETTGKPPVSGRHPCEEACNPEPPLSDAPQDVIKPRPFVEMPLPTAGAEILSEPDNAAVQAPHAVRNPNHGRHRLTITGQPLRRPSEEGVLHEHRTRRYRSAPRRR